MIADSMKPRPSPFALAALALGLCAPATLLAQAPTPEPTLEASLHEHRKRWPDFDRRCEEALAEGYERIEGGLVTATLLMFDPALGFYFELEPGQIQYVMNWACAHCRTEYEDFPDDDRKRHLVRIFLRDEGARSYNG